MREKNNKCASHWGAGWNNICILTVQLPSKPGLRLSDWEIDWTWGQSFLLLSLWRMKMKYLYYLSSGSYNKIPLTGRLKQGKKKSYSSGVKSKSRVYWQIQCLGRVSCVLTWLWGSSGLFFFLKRHSKPNMEATPLRKRKMKVLVISHVWLFQNQWTVARQAPLSMGFSRQEDWSELTCPPQGDRPDPGI